MRIKVELQFDVRAMTDEELRFCGVENEIDAEDELDGIDVQEVGRCIAGLFGYNSDASDKALAGSNIFLKIGRADLVRAEVSHD